VNSRARLFLINSWEQGNSKWLHMIIKPESDSGFSPEVKEDCCIDNFSVELIFMFEVQNKGKNVRRRDKKEILNTI